jgi:flagellar hook-associated protein 3 FlgL
MITNLTPSSALFLANLNNIEQRLAEANSQVSSGKKINVASDAPDQLQSLLQLRTDEQQNTQIEANLTLAKTDASAADSALNSASQLMDQAISLATQGANSTSDAAGRQAIAGQIAALQQQMVNLSQTQVQGSYIFSGDADSRPTYQLDLAANAGPAAISGVDQLSAAAASRQIQDPQGGTFAASETASQIFDSPGASVFAALNGLRTALLANDQPAIQNSISNLQAANTQINNSDSFYGTVENEIDNANTFAANYDLQLQTEISSIQDADIAQASMEITQTNTQMEAAFEAQARMPTHTLFNYLG